MESRYRRATERRLIVRRLNRCTCQGYDGIAGCLESRLLTDSQEDSSS